MQELQVVLLKFREELISEKVGRERDCELLRSELALMRSHVADIERSQQQMNAEISHLREQLSKCCCSAYFSCLVCSLFFLIFFFVFNCVLCTIFVLNK